MRTIGFGSVEGRSIFMDERTDSYFGIDPSLEADVEAVMESGGLIGRRDRLRAALEIADEPVRIIRSSAASPTGSLVDQTGVRKARLADIVKAASLLLDVRRSLRSRSIDILLADVFRARGETIEGVQLIERASRFLAARKAVPISQNCLLDSLSLVRWLGGAGVSIHFGVKLNPFAAHCWVQSGTFVLNDRTENVAAFAVVRMVGCSDPTP